MSNEPEQNAEPEQNPEPKPKRKKRVAPPAAYPEDKNARAKIRYQDEITKEFIAKCGAYYDAHPEELMRMQQAAIAFGKRTSESRKKRDAALNNTNNEQTTAEADIDNRNPGEMHWFVFVHNANEEILSPSDAGNPLHIAEGLAPGTNRRLTHFIFIFKRAHRTHFAFTAAITDYTIGDRDENWLRISKIVETALEKLNWPITE